MMELLIGMVIIWIALMGSGSLILAAMKANRGGTTRELAVLLANDISERMEANREAALAGSYVLGEQTTPSAGTDCARVKCSAAQLAAYDLLRWDEQIKAGLTSPTRSIARTVAGTPSTYQITLTWTDRAWGGRPSTGTETFSYVVTRTIAP